MSNWDKPPIWDKNNSLLIMSSELKLKVMTGMLENASEEKELNSMLEKMMILEDVPSLDPEISLNKVIKIEFLAFPLSDMIFKNHRNRVSLTPIIMQMKLLQYSFCSPNNLVLMEWVMRTLISQDQRQKYIKSSPISDFNSRAIFLMPFSKGLKLSMEPSLTESAATLSKKPYMKCVADLVKHFIDHFILTYKIEHL